MNFLAHIFLSGENEKIMVGNFIGDFVKGKNAIQQFETDIAHGIELHRLIDEFTDSHPVVTESKNRLRPKYRHYSGVIVDVFYDHFLAKNFTAYHPVPLDKFASNAYATMERYHAILPEGVNHMLPYMKRGNWLFNYREIEGIHRALSGMASRTPFKSNMEHASEDLRAYFNEFNNEFDRFFPELQKACNEKLASWHGPPHPRPSPAGQG